MMIAQGLPIAAALFLLFPRLASPLWGLPADHTATTGLSERMAPKLRPVTTGADAGAAVARGDAQFGVLPLSEILPVKGVEVLGPFPADVQDPMVMVGGIGAAAKQRAAATALLTYLKSPAVRPVLQKKGMQPATQ